MTDTHTLIAQAYSAFNDRDIDRALALMSEKISWPKASEGGRALGKEEIRNYWIHQWQELHIFTIQNGLIEQMNVKQSEHSDLQLDSEGRWKFPGSQGGSR